MRKYGSVFFFSFVFIAMFCLTNHAFAGQEAPDGEVAAPPPLDMKGPPDVVVVPSEQYPEQEVYMVPNMTGVYVYQNMWYRNYDGVWFSSPAYNGRWAYVGAAIVPPVIVSVPVEYALYLPPDYYRIHWVDYHRNWRYWSRNHYWQRQNWYRREMRADIRRDRMHQIEQHRREARAQREFDRKRSGHGADARGGKDTARGGKDFAKPGVKKDQNTKGDQNVVKKPGVKMDQSKAKGGLKNNQGQSLSAGQPMKKDNQPQMKQVQKQPQPGQQVQKQPQSRPQIQKQSQPRQQAPKQQAQKRPPARKDDNKKNH